MRVETRSHAWESDKPGISAGPAANCWHRLYQSFFGRKRKSRAVPASKSPTPTGEPLEWGICETCQKGDGDWIKSPLLRAFSFLNLLQYSVLINYYLIKPRKRLNNPTNT